MRLCRIATHCVSMPPLWGLDVPLPCPHNFAGSGVCALSYRLKRRGASVSEHDGPTPDPSVWTIEGARNRSTCRIWSPQGVTHRNRSPLGLGSPVSSSSTVLEVVLVVGVTRCSGPTRASRPWTNRL